ncbi:DMT family transporter [Bacillus salitolerans]|uniref:DMT family transporter n=1 Tax=Bacillus salitolerans TaxID=1437434 RepID=A0ABW4LJV9_9BACI
MKLRLLAIGTAVIVTLLWSSSYFLNVFAFNEGVGPMTLAGLRYFVAATVLYIVSLRMRSRRNDHRLSLKMIVGLGVTGFIIAQGMQYAGQYYLTPTQTSLLLNIGNTTLVAVIASLAIKEKLSLVSMIGIIGVSFGAALYYFPWSFALYDVIGIGLVLISSVGYAIHLTWTRHLVKGTSIHTSELVMKPMFIGAVGMLIVGLTVEGVPEFSWKVVGIVLWLGTINGSVAFTLWTWSQKYLEAFESSIINNLMLVEIALFDIIILSRQITTTELIGLILVCVTIVTVQTIPMYQKKNNCQ